MNSFHPEGGVSEDFSLKSLYIRGTNPPHPRIYALKGGELTLIEIKKRGRNEPES
jgi:hypothetical protein